MDDDQDYDGYPSWIDETVTFFLVLGSCMAVAYGAFKFAQFLGWVPDFWWLP